jgi:hypothetical protein
MASVQSSLMMADTTPCDSANENSAAEPDDKPVDTQPTLTIAQLFFNNTKKNTVSSDKYTRKNKAQETPLPIFLSMKVYNETRSMILVKILYDYGLGITPNRLSDVLDDIACALCEGHPQGGPSEPVGAPEPTEPVGATTTPFMSAMAIDQQGEQMVKVWKSQGGPSNVTQKSAAMLEEI